jgi:hypothetical protein
MRLGGGDDRDRGPPLQVVRQEERVEEIFSILEAAFELTRVFEVEVPVTSLLNRGGIVRHVQ